jgi:hypothetical protein
MQAPRLCARLNHRPQPALVHDSAATNFGHHTLMPRFTADLRQPGAIRSLDLDTVLPRSLDDGLDPRVGRLILGINTANVGRFGGQQLLHRTQARNVVRFAHLRLFLLADRFFCALGEISVTGRKSILRVSMSTRSTRIRISSPRL